MKNRMFIGLLLMGLPVHQTMAWDWEWEIDWDRVHRIGAVLAEELAPADWQGVWQEVYQSLRTGDFVDVAWLRPEVEVTLDFLRQFEETKPFADWLLQRWDYIDVAHGAVEAHAPPAHRRAPPTEPPTVRPVPQPSPEPLPADNRREIRRQASSQETWNQRLAGRPMPERAEALAPTLRRIFEEEGVPPELIWVAEVESSFNPAARSPVGALGLFQFMPATAESFGMSLAPVDQRLDPELNARAAAQYLRQLYRRFGSWSLALAAYNGGQGRVARLLRQHEASRFEEIAPYLPSETQMYVPKVMATIALREGIDPQQMRGVT